MDEKIKEELLKLAEIRLYQHDSGYEMTVFDVIEEEGESCIFLAIEAVRALSRAILKSQNIKFDKNKDFIDDDERMALLKGVNFEK